MKNRGLATDQTLADRLSTCGTQPGEQCELNTGQPRNAPHRERIWAAKGQAAPYTETSCFNIARLTPSPCREEERPRRCRQIQIR